ncbi:MAG: ATP-binding protein [Pirellulales bacterium]
MSQADAAVTLENCEDEPIHRPGAVQPHGVLVACRGSSFEVAHVSANVEALFHVAPADLLGRSVFTLFDDADVAVWEGVLRREVPDVKPVYMFTVGIKNVAEPYDAIAHRSGDLVFLEFEPSTESDGRSAPNFIAAWKRRSANSARPTPWKPAATSAPSKFAASTASIASWSIASTKTGTVRSSPSVAATISSRSSACTIRLPTFPHRPASSTRRIGSASFPIAITRPRRSSAEPARRESTPDLSFAVLRSVSPMHVEYLRNMGVCASMSISLLREGRLWGLIACHHYSPKFVPYDVRTACELLGQVMSLTLSVAEEQELGAYRREMAAASEAILDNVARLDDTATGLTQGSPSMLDFIEADGAAVVVGDSVLRIGQTPGEAEILALSRHLFANDEPDVYATDRLGETFGGALLGSVAAGVLVASFTSSRPHQMFWFRTEQIRTVDWAGDPAKSIIKGDGAVRLSPRGSFPLWKETVRGRSNPWTSQEREAVKQLRDGLMRFILTRSEATAARNRNLELADNEREAILQAEREARAASERLNRMKDDFVATLSHELRTPLNSILGWAQILRHTARSPQEVAEGIEVIERNARAQAQMIEDLLDVSRIISGKLRLDLQEIYLPSIVNDALETVRITAANKGVRIEKLIDPLVGVQTTGDPGRLQQVVWNLLSNAVKFTPKGGKVQVVLERVDSHVELSVSDTGQGIRTDFLPHIFDRFRQADSSASRVHGGLGLGLSIVRNLVELHGGAVRARRRRRQGSDLRRLAPRARAATCGRIPPRSPPGPRGPGRLRSPEFARFASAVRRRRTGRP